MRPKIYLLSLCLDGLRSFVLYLHNIVIVVSRRGASSATRTTQHSQQQQSRQIRIFCWIHFLFYYVVAGSRWITLCFPRCYVVVEENHRWAAEERKLFARDHQLCMIVHLCCCCPILFCCWRKIFAVLALPLLILLCCDKFLCSHTHCCNQHQLSPPFHNNVKTMSYYKQSEKGYNFLAEIVVDSGKFNIANFHALVRW